MEDKRQEKVPRIHLSLLENAYDSFNESLAKAEQAEKENPFKWKFALLHLVHTIELLLKQRLHEEHPLFIYEDIDRQTKTVSLEKAVARLQKLGVTLGQNDIHYVKQAIKARNTIMHFEVDLHVNEVRRGYLQIFDFLDTFHVEHFGQELSVQAATENQPTVTWLLESVRREFLKYEGEEMHHSWPSKLLAAQKVPAFFLNGTEFLRIPWGKENQALLQDVVSLERCGDCLCKLGQLHGPACDMEECPRCGKQLLSCTCDFDESELWALL